MNTENIKLVRDTLASLPSERVNMNFWSNRLVAAPDGNQIMVRAEVPPEVLAHDCGTCGCIGGWTNAIFKQDPSVSAAAYALGLSEDTGWALFYPNEFSCDQYENTTQAQMVKVLDILLETGKVNWTRALAEA